MKKAIVYCQDSAYNLNKKNAEMEWRKNDIKSNNSDNFRRIKDNHKD